MVRVSSGLQRQRSHKKYIKAAKGFRLGRKKWSKYSAFIGQMSKKNILLNRKVLSNIAVAFPEVFDKIYKEVVK